MKNWDTELDKEVEAYKSWKERFGGLSRDMTLRDYFAAKALQGMLAESDCFWDDAAHLAYQYADAMLKARGK